VAAVRAPVRILFVCTGNICRSPTAEGVFRHMVRAQRLEQLIEIESAGTHGYHVGSAPDKRTQAAAASRGYDLSAQRARQVTVTDFPAFDFILAMDRENLAILQQLAPQELRHKLGLFLDHSDGYKGKEVPDPYYGGEAGFALVLDMVEDAASGLIASAKKKLGLLEAEL
jgi:protein-tyrosine phosphatase